MAPARRCCRTRRVTLGGEGTQPQGHLRPGLREGMGMGSQADRVCLGSGVQMFSGGTMGLLQNRTWNSQGGSIGWTLQFGDNLHPTR